MSVNSWNGIPTLTLNTGASIPQLGFGTYKVTEDAESIVRQALEVGYRHIDTAQMYHNEAEVGRAVAASGIDREDIFITSKLDNTNHEPDVARRVFTETLRDLRTDYVDLFLIHWPLPQQYGGDFLSTWKTLEEFVADGRARAIGVSNFEPHHIQVLLDKAEVVPAVNQVESHPYFTNAKVHEFNARNGIRTEAWSPLARGSVISDPVLVKIAERIGVSAAQVALRWAIQRGDIIFPKASTAERQYQNMDLFSFELTPEDMRIIGTVNRGEEGRTGMHPDTMKHFGEA